MNLPQVKRTLIGCGLIVVNSWLFGAVPCEATVSVNGHLESCQIIALKDSNEFLSSFSGGTLELTAENDNTTGFLSANLYNNSVETTQDALELKEAYLDYLHGSLDFRIGRQLIVWGKADGVTVTDLICPADYRDYFCREFSDAKKPVVAAQGRFQKRNMIADLVWEPFFEAPEYPEEGNPWLSTTETEEGSAIRTPDQPEKNLKNSEWFGRIALNQAGFDYAFTAFYCWWDTPVYQAYNEEDAMVLRGDYYRVSGIGSEFSAPAGDFVWRGEAAFMHGRRFERKSYSGDYLERDTVKALLGMDWYPGDNWTVTGQLAAEWIADYDPRIAQSEYSPVGTLKIGRKFLRETLNVSGAVYASLEETDYYLKLSAEYALTDELHLTVGWLIFDGDTDGTFGIYCDKDSLLLKIKYSF